MTDIEAVARAETAAAQDTVREYLKRFLLERDNPLYTLSQASHDIIKSMIDAGWKSPAEVAEIDKAAQAKMKDITEWFDRELVVLGDAHPSYEYTKELENTLIGHLESLRSWRALTPSSGPWQRVPEGFSITDAKTATRILTELGIAVEPSYDVGADQRRDRVAAIIAQDRAMIAAGGKP